MKDKKTTKKKKDKGLVLYCAIIAVIIIAYLIFRFKIRPVTVIGESMYPTYSNGDLLSSSMRPINELSVGDVVVFTSIEDDDKTIIKRIEGMPGDIIQIIDGNLYRNGELVEEGYELISDPGIAAEPYVVPANCLFVLGDNRNNSHDSRSYAAIPYDSLIGVVERTIYSRN